MRRGEKSRAPEGEASGKRKPGRPIVRLITVCVLVSALVFAGNRYVNSYYHATGVAKAALQGNDWVQVSEEEDYYLFAPVSVAEEEAQEPVTGIIFYPGAKVEESAYAPLMSALAECGYRVYLMRMPARLAILDADAAESVMAADPDVAEWVLMGHSLGGAMAAGWAADNGQEVSALVLLAAYSTADLGDSDIQVLSIYGSEDGVLNREKYAKYWSNLPETAKECVIEGGNHAGFGDYGQQKGDWEAEISAREQQQAVVDAVSYSIRNPQ